MTESTAAPRVLRIAGIADFLVACLCLATPMLRTALGDLTTYAFAATLLAGSGIMFVLARRMEQQAASRSVSPAR